MSDDAPPPSAAKPPPSTSSKKNIVSAEDPCQPRWQSGATESSLSALYEYVVRASMRSEEWYWKNKTWKARGSHFVRWTAVVLTGLAAILPVSIQAGLFPGLGTWLGAHGIIKQLDSGLLSSFLIAISAGLVAFDRASGLSSGWARYVLTGAAIRSACEEFRMDWMALRSQLEDPAKPEQIAALIQRAKTFRMAVEGLVMKETQEWATEFQNNLAEMEKD
ncbi:MAG TPA: SLATT domain-containing protein, partial [Polyangiaceae bacterium]